MTRPTGRVTVRPATHEDLAALVETYLSSARHHADLDAAFYRVPPRAAAEVRLATLVDARGPASEYVVAVVDGRIVGSASVQVLGVPSEGSMVRPVRSAEAGVAVLEAWRDRGIGSVLLRHIEAWARDQGVERVVLDMSATNAGAIRLYHRLGYESYGDLMRRDL